MTKKKVIISIYHLSFIIIRQMTKAQSEYLLDNNKRQAFFTKFFQSFVDKFMLYDGEMKHGQDFEKSSGSPAPTKSLSAGKTEESIAI